MMDSLTTLTTFLGWCSVISIGILLYSTIMLTLFRRFAKSLHQKWFGVKKADLDLIYFNFLGYLKLAIIMLNIVPYLALRIML